MAETASDQLSNVINSNSDDLHNGYWMLSSSWSLTILSLVFLVLRCYCRRHRHHGLRLDDYVLISAWGCLLIATVVVTYNVNIGFGQHIYNVDPVLLPKVTLIGQVTLVFAVLGAVWSKTSWALTILPLSQGWSRTMIWVILITANLSMYMSVVFNFVQCTPINKFWQPYIEGSCWRADIVPKYSTFSGTYSGFMDIFLALLPWLAIRKTQMKATERFGVATAMSCGVFAGATAFVKSFYVMTLGSRDPIFDVAPLIVWGSAEIAVTIIAASIPILRVLARDVSASMSRRKKWSRGESSRLHGSSVGSGRVLMSSSEYGTELEAAGVPVLGAQDMSKRLEIKIDFEHSLQDFRASRMMRDGRLHQSQM
ncbi:hypothetical protein F5Y15DRAFT_104494 [Xylariaceae sp. FL0016]|nr:hypothetical protein F5Y15DRAFT_104494 [Xylariaceae sp. FL0016]